MIQPTINNFQGNLTESLGYFRKATQLKLAQKYEEAVETYRQAINCADNTTELAIAQYHYNLGEVLTKLERWSEAAISYRIACKLNPKSAWSYSNLAEALVKLELFDEAVTCFRQAITILGKGKLVTTLYYNLGQILQQLERFDEAIDSYQKLVQIEPNFTTAYLQLGVLYYQKSCQFRTENLFKKKLDELYCEILASVDNETFIQAVYRAYLGREVDETGKSFYLPRLEAGIYTRLEFIEQIRLSVEFSLASQHFSEQEQLFDQCFCQILSSLDDVAFVEEVYKAYLRREADEGGKNFYQKWLEVSINTRQELIRQIRSSIEFGIQSKQFKEHPIILKIKRFYLEKAQNSYQFIQRYNSNIFCVVNKQLGEVYKQLVIVFAEMGELENALGYYEKAIAIHSEIYLEPDDWEIYYKLAEIYLTKGWRDYGNNQLLSSINHTSKAIDFYQIQLQLHPLSKTNIRFLSCDKFEKGHWPTQAIGYIAMIVDLYLKMCKLGWRSEYETILLAPTKEIVNPCLLNYWRDHLCIISDSKLIDKLLPIGKRLSFLDTKSFYIKLPNGQMVDQTSAMSLVQRQWENEKNPPLLSLSAADRERGRRCLVEVGIPQDAWFVSLHVRSAGYYGQGGLSYRDADIDTYLPAIESIVAKGGWVIRLGDRTMKPLPKMKNTFDYVHSPLKSDWMDVFLCTQCHFFLGTSSGLISVPWVFNTPSLMTNTFPLASVPPTSNSMFIPKLYWSEKERSYISFLEILEPKIFFNLADETYKQCQIKPIDNTPEEINDVVLEMLDILDGKINYTIEDEILWQRFQSLPYPYGSSCFNSRMGRGFLRKYAGLLPQSQG